MQVCAEGGLETHPKGSSCVAKCQSHMHIQGMCSARTDPAGRALCAHPSARARVSCWRILGAEGAPKVVFPGLIDFD